MSEQHRTVGGRHRRHDRQRAVGVALLLSLLGLVLAAPGFASAGTTPVADAPSPVARSSTAPTGSSDPVVVAQQTGFNNGAAKAAAQVNRIAPGVGGLALGVDSGVALADYVNSLARANAHGMNLGLVGTVFEAPGACGPEPAPGEPPPEPEQQSYRAPRPLVIDSNSPEGEKSVDAAETGPGQEGPAQFNGPQVGRQYVKADKTPFSQAITTVNPIRIPPEQTGLPAIVEIGGGTAEATAGVVNGNTRRAFSRVDASVSFLGGAVTLDGMHWEATHQTGADPVKVASFTLSSSTQSEGGGLLGLPIPALPADGSKITEDALNAALLPFGIATRFPRVERQTAPSDLVRVTPMVIELVNSPATAAALGPILELTREQKEQMFATIVASEIECQLDGYKKSGLLVADILVSVAAGTGFLEIEIGGAEATSEDVQFINPFANFGPTPPPIPPPPTDLPTSRGTVTPPAGVTAGAPSGGAGSDGGSTGDAQLAASQPISTSSGAAIDEFCRSVHDVTGLSCVDGAMVALGILGLIGTLGMAALDWRYQQRGPRSMPGDNWVQSARRATDA